jgi:hypothetical protein
MQRAKRLVWSGSHGLACELFLRKLTIGAMSNKLLYVCYNIWPIKTYTECFTDQCPRCGMVTTGARMYFCQEFNTVFLLNALH